MEMKKGGLEFQACCKKRFFPRNPRNFDRIQNKVNRKMGNVVKRMSYIIRRYVAHKTRVSVSCVVKNTLFTRLREGVNAHIGVILTPNGG